MGVSAPRETVDKSAVQGLLNLTTLGKRAVKESAFVTMCGNTQHN